jgi:sortase A
MLMTDEKPTNAISSRRKWRLSVLSVVIAVVCLVGIGVALYPSAAQWFSSIQEAQQVQEYGNAVKVVGPASRLKALNQARSYNSVLDSGAEVKANERLPVDIGATLPTGFDYNKLLEANSSGLMGRIVIPSIKADLPIYHGTSDPTLAQGIGHLEGTSLPVGGKGTHAVLAGHRGLASATLFTNLNEVKDGDTFTIYVFGETLTYKVFSVKVVDPDQTKELDPVAGKDLVTLVTCTPIGINSQRILVTGERELPTPKAAVAGANEPPAGPGFPWWGVGLAAALAGAVWYVWWSGRPVGPRGAQAVTRGPAHSSARKAAHLATTAEVTDV